MLAGENVRWHAHCNRASGYIAEHDSVRANRAIVLNVDGTQDLRAGADVYPIS